LTGDKKPASSSGGRPDKILTWRQSDQPILASVVCIGGLDREERASTCRESQMKRLDDRANQDLSVLGAHAACDDTASKELNREITS
jgi:hypothetical protein